MIAAKEMELVAPNLMLNIIGGHVLLQTQATGLCTAATVHFHVF